MKNKNQFRQGDVLIERVESLPIKPKRGKRTILAHGEVTGHAHEIDSQLATIEEVKEAWQLLGDLPEFTGLTRQALEVRTDGPVTHQEHGPIGLDEGGYRVTRQREYSPEAIRRVAD